MGTNHITKMLRFVVVSGLLAVASASLISPHILGGQETTIQQHPYQAAVLKHGEHYCGAVILSDKHVLSTAQCLFVDPSFGKTEDYQIRLGSTFLTKGAVFDLKSIIPHDYFMITFNYYDYNVAVAVLNTPIVFSAVAQPIALVPVNQHPQVGEILTISGWGNPTSTQSNEFSEKLRALSIPVVDKEECKEKLPREQVMITRNMFCASNGPQKETLGDIGGPVVNAKNQLVGLFTLSSGKYYLETPNVYVNIASPAIHDFIVKNTQ